MEPGKDITMAIHFLSIVCDLEEWRYVRQCFKESRYWDIRELANLKNQEQPRPQREADFIAFDELEGEAS